MRAHLFLLAVDAARLRSWALSFCLAARSSEAVVGFGLMVRVRVRVRVRGIGLG